MPTYVYETIPKAGEAPERFEFQQRMSDPPYKNHPETGAPLRRVFTAPFIGGAAKGESRKESAQKPADAQASSTESTTTEAPAAAAEPTYTHTCSHGCAH